MARGWMGSRGEFDAGDEDHVNDPHADLLAALNAIAIALQDPSGGEYWTARAYLDKHGIFHGDLNDERVLLKVAETAINKTEGK